LRVMVKLFGGFRDRSPSGPGVPYFWIELEDGASVNTIFARLGIPGEEPREIIRNHRLGTPDDVLEDEDVIAIFPPLAGGG
jgi:molybdopterin converting factor small subunit